MVRVLTAEDRMEQQECRLDADVIEAALAWRRAYLAYERENDLDRDARLRHVDEIEQAEDAMSAACDALLAFLGEDQSV